jgi:hypothetical protein
VVECLAPLLVRPRVLRRVQTFFGGRHGVDLAAVEVPVPGGRADGEEGGAGGEGIVLPRGARSLGRARCRGEALHHRSVSQTFN